MSLALTIFFVFLGIFPTWKLCVWLLGRIISLWGDKARQRGIAAAAWKGETEVIWPQNLEGMITAVDFNFQGGNFGIRGDFSFTDQNGHLIKNLFRGRLLHQHHLPMFYWKSDANRVGPGVLILTLSPCGSVLKGVLAGFSSHEECYFFCKVRLKKQEQTSVARRNDLLSVLAS
jgi:hypothetical protein